MVNALELMVGTILIAPAAATATYLADRYNQYSFRREPDFPQFEARQRILFERIKGMEVFPGTLEEFERLKGQPYEAIDVPETEKFLFEESHGALPIRHSLKTLSRRDVYLEPYNLRSSVHPPGILEQAAKLGADAVVEYRVVFSYNPPTLFHSSPTINCKIGLPVKKKAVEVVTAPT